MEKKIKYFTSRELKALFKVIDNDKGKYAIRNQAIFRIAYYCGLRVSEISIIEKEDFNSMNSEIYCKRLKGSQNNTLRIIDPVVLRCLKRYMRKNEDDSRYMFTSRIKKPISRKTLDFYMKKYCSEAKIADKSKWHFHTLKHTRAIDLAEQGLDLKDIQYWLGHKEIANTQIYFEYTSKQQENLYRILNQNGCR